MPEAAQNEQAPIADEPASFRELAPAIEFCCWVAVALCPVLRWANGAAVTRDQFWLQVILSTLALGGGLGIRIYRWRHGSVRRENDLDQSHWQVATTELAAARPWLAHVGN